ncbi:hypothetical protein T484DRAFT_1778697 [Baffinella frigidus]|nr:hypothetical protein T484DRAFT_1778697 [Cryptophyta sp. CCMP2293]
MCGEMITFPEGGQAVEDGHPHLISVIDSPGHVDFCSEDGHPHLISVIDSPGHVDFCSEVRPCVETFTAKV